METASIHNYTSNAYLSRIILSAGFLLLFLHHFIFSIPQNAQWIFFVITILVAGIPHGALDHLVAQQNSIAQNKYFSSLRFYLTYLSRMVIYGACWYLFPSIAMILFIVMSAFHFGETDINIPLSSSNMSERIFQIAYGLMIVFVLVFSHREEVLPILLFLEPSTDSILFTLFQQTSILILLSVTVVFMLLSLAWLQIKQPQSLKWYFSQFAQIGSLIVAMIFLPFPMAFAFYFGCWHSLHSLENIRRHLSGSGNNTLLITDVLKKCIPYSVIAFTGITLLALVANYTGNKYLLLFIFFVGIAILTAPHLEVMSTMYTQVRKKDHHR
ncbi:Brp/Blh family beta-carotene 15,15'-dioxygenase [Sediminibacterium sp.]|jgi:beta-carotene 15,15'-dioxygenase|uniref:Brp/Blh family beta-carotene 15,15'-dioxygenase n=1 Tax=Sediminibacterium sp. TaxID=1917865 RepID=UPI0025FB42B6|nr:Brp/Blh family beta-carotene 15,15'-dioxygenase [Sediminibacterium sp.]MBW0176893.1 Brp/Blh family beta-carotene 15,15'-dioxygenase [Sediminibacterium sp.]